MPIADSATYFVDANIPMYAAGTDHPLKTPCLAILDQVARGQIKAVTDTDVIQEILHRYTSLAQRSRGIEMAKLFLHIVPVLLSPRREDIERALELHAKYGNLQARDSIHAAVMHGAHISHIISADQHFDSVSGIQRQDPMQWAAR